MCRFGAGCVAGPPPELTVREASGVMTPEQRKVAVIGVAVILALILISGLALMLISPG